MMLDDKNFTKYLNRHEIDAAVQSIANRINADYEGKSVVLVGVLKGAIIFMADLVRHLKIDAKSNSSVSPATEKPVPPAALSPF